MSSNFRFIMSWKYFLWLLSVLNAVGLSVKCFEEFSEKLELVQLRDGSVLAEFGFRINIKGDSLKLADIGRYHIYPYQLGEIVKKYKVDKLHLTNTRGNWDYKIWGQSTSQAPPGIELWGNLNIKDENDRKDGWIGLTNMLSGISASGLDVVGFKHSWAEIESNWDISVPGNYPETNEHNKSSEKMFHSYLPGHVLCLDDISKFIDLLPCKNKAGLASLLDSHNIIEDGGYLSLSTEIKRSDDNKIDKNLDVILKISVVFSPLDIWWSSRNYMWNIWSFFKRGIASTCLPAASSEVIVHGAGVINTTFYGDFEIMESSENLVAKYETKKIIENLRALKPEGVKISMIEPQEASITYKKPPIHVDRYLIGKVGGELGLIVVIDAKDLSTGITAPYLQIFPWFIKPLLHTLKITVDKDGIFDGNHLAKSIKYKPTGFQNIQNLVSMNLDIPPGSIVQLEYKFTFLYRKHSEYYADINNLVDLGQGILTIPSLDKIGSAPTQLDRLFFPPLSIRIPVTDFSMPYNVILAVSSCFSLTFCSILNILTRKYRIRISKSAVEKRKDE